MPKGKDKEEEEEENSSSSVAVAERETTSKTKRNRGKVQRLPKGVKEDEFGYYMMRPSTRRGGEANIKVEVIMDENGDRGRARANQLDCIYYVAESQQFLYRGVKLITPGMGPCPPKPPDLYTNSYPGWDPSKTRGRRFNQGQQGGLGHGTRTDLMPVEDTSEDGIEPSRAEKVATAINNKKDEE